MPLISRSQPRDINPESTLVFEEDNLTSPRTYDLNSSLGGSSVVDMYFTNGGAVTTPTAGTVRILGAIDVAPWPFRLLANGEFSAADTGSDNFALPNSYGGIRRLRIELTGVTGVDGFRIALMQRNN